MKIKIQDYVLEYLDTLSATLEVTENGFILLPFGKNDITHTFTWQEPSKCYLVSTAINNADGSTTPVINYMFKIATYAEITSYVQWVRCLNTLRGVSNGKD